MSLEKIKDFTDYDNYPPAADQTTNAEMQDYMGNQNRLLKALVKRAWQPATTYAVGDIVMSPDMANGVIARCVTEGTTDTNEPTWGAVGTAVVDNSVVWEMRNAYAYFLATAADVTNLYAGKQVTGDKVLSIGTLLTMLTSPTFTGTPKAPTATAGDNTTRIATTAFVMKALEVLEDYALKVDGVQIGDVVYRPYLKAGYVKGNGATVNRADYPTLEAFADEHSLWTTTPATEPWKYGVGDGNTTMVLPDYRGQFIQGGDTPSAVEAGLPNITGSIGQTFYSAEGAFFESPSTKSVGEANRMANRTYNRFDASKSNSIYGGSNTVQPPAIILIPQIKY